MAPAELEMYHQIKNVIGVNPSFYEVLGLLPSFRLRKIVNLSRSMTVLAHGRRGYYR